MADSFKMGLCYSYN